MSTVTEEKFEPNRLEKGLEGYIVGKRYAEEDDFFYSFYETEAEALADLNSGLYHETITFEAIVGRKVEISKSTRYKVKAVE